MDKKPNKPNARPYAYTIDDSDTVFGPFYDLRELRDEMVEVGYWPDTEGRVR